MIHPEAVNRFVDKQKRLLRGTYDTAWQRGADSYQPDADPAHEPSAAQKVATAALAGAALLAARRAYRYVAPPSPDPMRRAVALAPSYRSLNAMRAELATLTPGPVADASTAVSAVARAGGVAQAGATVADIATQAGEQIATAQDAFASAILDWVSSNAWRLSGGDSVAWAGEQAGYGEAADIDGQLLDWQDEGDESVCDNCQTLGSMPPQPLADWPCQPGDGATACNVGCRCSLEASDISILPGDTYAPELSAEQEQTISGLADAQQAALASALPDAQYLD